MDDLWLVVSCDASDVKPIDVDSFWEPVCVWCPGSTRSLCVWPFPTCCLG